MTVINFFFWIFMFIALTMAGGHFGVILCKHLGANTITIPGIILVYAITSFVSAIATAVCFIITHIKIKVKQKHGFMLKRSRRSMF